MKTKIFPNLFLDQKYEEKQSLLVQKKVFIIEI